MAIEKKILLTFLVFVDVFVLLMNVCLEMTSTSWRHALRPVSPRLPPHSSVSLNDIYCDDDCVRFRSLVSNSSAWPNGKPRAVVVMLIGRTIGSTPTVVMFEAFAKDFDRHFNDHFRYPLIVFYELKQFNNSELEHLRMLTRSLVFFQAVNFTIPSFINQSSPLERCDIVSQGIGYKHMCRFHAKGIYEQPIMQTEGLEYVWRLDDDSVLTSNVTYDLIRYMRDRKLRYGHTGTYYDGKCWIVGLWKAADEFWDRLGIQRKFRWPDGLYYYNNFEISSMSLWRSREYLEYIEYIDQLGGIYYHRWGDATIKSIAVSRLLKDSEVHRFTDIGYRHNIHIMSVAPSTASFNAPNGRGAVPIYQLLMPFSIVLSKHLTWY